LENGRSKKRTTQIEGKKSFKTINCWQGFQPTGGGIFWGGYALTRGGEKATFVFGEGYFLGRGEGSVAVAKKDPRSLGGKKDFDGKRSRPFAEKRKSLLFWGQNSSWARGGKGLWGKKKSCYIGGRGLSGVRILR